MFQMQTPSLMLKQTLSVLHQYVKIVPQNEENPQKQPKFETPKLSHQRRSRKQ